MKRRRKLYDAAQNAAIFLLTCSAAFLVLGTGVIRPEALSRALPDVTLSADRPRQDTKVNTVLPVQIVLRSGGDCRAFSHETTAGVVFEDVGSLLTQALDSADDPVTVEETEYRRALENNGIYYDFYNALPLPVLAQWLGGSGSPGVHVRALLLSGLEDGYLTLYGEGSDAFYRWQTTVPTETLASALDRHAGTAAEFAFLRGTPYDTLEPYTVICEERPALPELLAEDPIGAEEQNVLLAKLEFNLQSKDRYSYTEANGTWVIVQGNRTLRILPDGRLLYSGAAASYMERIDEESTLTEYVDGAWNMVHGLFDPDLGDASFCLLSAEMTGRGSAHITFGYSVNGYPVELRGGKAVEIDIADGMLTGFTAYLRRYTMTEKQSLLLPVPQAAAASDDGTGRELFCGYFDDGTELIRPGWMRR